MVLIFFALGFPGGARTQQPPAPPPAGAPQSASEGPLGLARLSGPVSLDGPSDEAAWQAVAPLPLTMHAPVFRGTPTQRSEIRVAYDDESLYVAGRFYDTDGADGVRVNSLYRDRWNGDDALAIYIDAYNDNRNAKWFGVTPAATRYDILVSDDGQVTNSSWDAFWDARTQITEEGWFVEVRIPFSTIGFRDVGGTAVMGLTVTRLVARSNERVTFPVIDPRYQFRQPSVARDVVLTGVRAETPLYLTPYALTGLQQTAALSDDALRFGQEREYKREVGMDARYVLSSELTLDATLNTDFAQVEADDQQVNLDRFSLFFPEKRRFFQERSDLFDLSMGSSGGRLFHSRRIGIGEDNQRVPVLGGARLVGSVGQTEVGILSMQTQGIAGLEGENFGVARVRRGLLNEFSTAGAMVTTRLGGRVGNVAYGLDSDIRVFGDEYLSMRWAQSFDEAQPSGTGALDRSQWHLTWHRRSTDGLTYQVSTTRSGASYEPRLGFLPRRNFTTANAFAQYFVYLDEASSLRRIWPGALALSTFRNDDGTLESGQYAVWIQWETKTGGGGWVEPKLFREDVATPFAIAEATIPEGSHTFADLQLVLRTGSSRAVRGSIDARAGSYFDGTRQQAILDGSWNVSPRLELGAEWQHTRLRFPDRDERADIDLARVRVRAALDARASATAFVQYNSTTDRVAVNFRARYNFSEGTDLWLVYDEALVTERDDPTGLRLPASAARALVLKYTHTMEW